MDRQYQEGHWSFPESGGSPVIRRPALQFSCEACKAWFNELGFRFFGDAAINEE